MLCLNRLLSNFNRQENSSTSRMPTNRVNLALKFSSRGDYSPIFTSPEATNCVSIITLMMTRENKIKKRHLIFERFWGFKMSVEGGSDRQQTGFLIIAAVGFPRGNVKSCETFI